MKNGKKYVVIAVLTLLIVLSAVGAVLAVVLNNSVKFQYLTRAATDEFAVDTEISDSSTYHFEAAAVTAVELKIARRHVNAYSPTPKFDLLIFGERETTVSASGESETVVTTGGGPVRIVRGVAYIEGMSLSVSVNEASDIRVVALPSDGNNRFVANLFELKMLNDEKLFNTAVLAVPEGKFQDYENIYFLDSVAVETDTLINSPAYLNLLYFDLVLNGDLTVKHPYRGAYAIESTGGVITGAAKLNIDAPAGFYRTGDIASLIDNPSRLNVICDVDFTASPTLMADLVEDAGAFALASVPDIVFGEVYLTRLYQGYPVTFEYEVSAAGVPSENWSPVRGLDNAEYELAVDVRYDGVFKSRFSKNVTVAGTGDAAAGETLIKYLNLNLRKLFRLNGGKYYMISGVYIGSILNDFIEESGYTSDITLTADKQRIWFEGGGARSSELKLVFTGGAYKAYLGGVETTLGMVSLKRENWIFDERAEILTVTCDGFIGTLSVLPAVKPAAEKTAYLERYVEHIFFNGVTDKAAVLYLGDDGLYRGDVLLLDSSLGYDAVTYAFYIVTEEAYDAVIDDASLQRAIDGGEDITAKFSVAGGYVGIKEDTVLSLRDGQTILMTVSFEGSEPYRTARRVIIPSQGLGGSEFTEYIKGNTFKPYFDSLDEGKLINSQKGETGSAYKFRSEYSELVFLDMYIAPELQADVASFCQLAHTTAPTDYWQINIDVDRVPPVNTVVRLVAEFYLAVDGARTVISTQRYSFIIPGIYRQGIGLEFPDERLYRFLTGVTDKDGLPLYDSYEGYLLSDGASASVQLLDIGSLEADSLDITGLELLIGTKGFILDGNVLTGLGAFSAASAPVSYLSLNGCGIDDAMLSGTTVRPLYNLKYLKSLYLDDNALTAVSSVLPYFYRTLETLSLKSNALTNIEGIGDYPALKTLYLQNNAIGAFEPLKTLGSLQAVYLAGNAAAEFGGKQTGDTNIYYGSAGRINLPVYVELILKGTRVYRDGDRAMELKTDVTDDELRAALILNAVALKNDNIGAIEIPKYAYEAGAGTVTAEFVFRYLVGGAAAIEGCLQSYDGDTVLNTNRVAPPSTVGNGRYKLIISVEVGDTVVYREFEVDYRKA